MCVCVTDLTMRSTTRTYRLNCIVSLMISNPSPFVVGVSVGGVSILAFQIFFPPNAMARGSPAMPTARAMLRAVLLLHLVSLHTSLHSAQTVPCSLVPHLRHTRLIPGYRCTLGCGGAQRLRGGFDVWGDDDNEAGDEPEVGAPPGENCIHFVQPISTLIGQILSY